jgi:GR25 family glycosyltransferase involved in LPS biosynthesis
MGLLYNWKIYIISVKENLERRTHVENLLQKLQKLGFTVEIIDAYYWKNINVLEKLNELHISFAYDGTLSQSQIACFLSHRLVWEKVQKSYENGLNEIPIILEDDMDLHDFELFSEMEKEMQKIDYKLLYDGIIMWKHPDKIPSDDKIQHISSNIINFYSQWGLCAYSIQPNLCTKMLSINYITNPIDDYLYDEIFPKYNMIMTSKDPFINHGFLGGYQFREHKFSSLIWE